MRNRQSYMQWVDYAKAVGIFAIVLSHALEECAVQKYLYTFHVPLFFFLSGAVFRVREEHMGTFLLRKAKRILRPYMLVAFISLLVLFALRGYLPDSFLERQNIGSFPEECVKILQGYCSANAPLWFLPCLFIVESFAWIQLRIVGSLRNRGSALLVLCGFAAVSVGWLVMNSYVLDFHMLPWKLETAIHMMAFFWFGSIYAQTVDIQCRGKKNVAVYAVLSIVLITVGMLAGNLNIQIKYLAGYYGNVLVYLFSACCGILGISILCMLLKRCRVIQYVGRHSLEIMVMHKFPVLFFQTVFPYTKTWMADTSAVGVIICAVVSAVSIAMCLAVGVGINKVFPWVFGESKPGLTGITEAGKE